MNANEKNANLEVVSNNPLVDAEFGVIHGAAIHAVAGTFPDVLDRTEELLQNGRRLVSAPLPPNVPLMRAPFRSVLIEKNTSRKYDTEGLNALAKARERVQTQRKNGKLLSGTDEDFAAIDREMLLRALRDVRLCAALDAPASHSQGS
ncbi:MAG: GrdX family protein [Synergistaceae bacterium]|jgi:hypothetical protein|nr:GrdX family protein [Synergistaceae bacterium]